MDHPVLGKLEPNELGLRATSRCSHLLARALFPPASGWLCPGTSRTREAEHLRLVFESTGWAIDPETLDQELRNFAHRLVRFLRETEVLDPDDDEPEG